MPKIADIEGPHKHGKTYRLRWTEDGEGAAQTGTRRELLALRLMLEGDREAERRPIKRLPSFGQPKFFKKAMAEAELSLRKAFNEGDDRGIKLARGYIAGLTDISSAWLPHSGYEELEAEHEELTKYHEETDKTAANDDGAQLQAEDTGISQTLEGGEGPSDPLRVAGNPLSSPGRSKQGGSH